MPTWMCMKETFCTMTLLILGPNVPAKDIDINLGPLIDEFKEP